MEHALCAPGQSKSDPGGSSATLPEAVTVVYEPRESDAATARLRPRHHTLADCPDWLATVTDAEGRPGDVAVLFGAPTRKSETSGAVRYAPERPAYCGGTGARQANLSAASLVDGPGAAAVPVRPSAAPSLDIALPPSSARVSMFLSGGSPAPPATDSNSNLPSRLTWRRVSRQTTPRQLSRPRIFGQRPLLVFTVEADSTFDVDNARD